MKPDSKPFAQLFRRRPMPQSAKQRTSAHERIGREDPIEHLRQQTLEVVKVVEHARLGSRVVCLASFQPAATASFSTQSASAASLPLLPMSQGDNERKRTRDVVQVRRIASHQVAPFTGDPGGLARLLEHRDTPPQDWRGGS